jgi:hypothetical protein
MFDIGKRHYKLVKLSLLNYQTPMHVHLKFQMWCQIFSSSHSAQARVLLTCANSSKHKQHLWLVSGLRSLHRLAIHYAMHISWAFELVEIAYLP